LRPTEATMGSSMSAWRFGFVRTFAGFTHGQ